MRQTKTKTKCLVGIAELAEPFDVTASCSRSRAGRTKKDPEKTKSEETTYV